MVMLAPCGKQPKAHSTPRAMSRSASNGSQRRSMRAVRLGCSSLNRGVLSWRQAGAYAVIQIAGCCTGAILAHAMFELPLIQASLHARTGLAQWLSEIVATLGLLLVVLGHRRAEDAPWMVAAWIGAAYWFTASTSFANPAITIARALSNTFSGIAPEDVPAFILAQFVGALAALLLARFIFNGRPAAGTPEPLRASISSSDRGANSSEA